MHGRCDLKSSEKSKQGLLAEVEDGCLSITILESGYGLREWAKRSEKSISKTYDATLRELVSNPDLRARVLDSIDHSAARVFSETGESTFDCFSSTVFAMQTLLCGLDRMLVLERLSLELLDSFVELRQQGKVTRAWLNALPSKRYKTDGRVYRFGELTRIALLAASLLGFHDEDPLFVWALENRKGIEETAPRRWPRTISDVLENEGYPRFDLWIVVHHEREIVRKVSFDTESLRSRRLLRESFEGNISYADSGRWR